jgi:hypothetical protein
VNNREDRVRRPDGNGAHSPVPTPRPPTPGPESPPAASAALPWSNILVGWGSDRTFRRDALIALTLVLIAVVVIVGMVTGALGPLVRDAAGNEVVRIVAGSVLGGGGLAYGGLRLRRRRPRYAKHAEPRCE